jgi:hypothetical protein
VRKQVLAQPTLNENRDCEEHGGEEIKAHKAAGLGVAHLSGCHLVDFVLLDTIRFQLLNFLLKLFFTEQVYITWTSFLCVFVFEVVFDCLVEVEQVRKLPVQQLVLHLQLVFCERFCALLIARSLFLTLTLTFVDVRALFRLRLRRKQAAR